MIGFVAALSASLAVIVLVVVSTLIAFLQAITPKVGIKEINVNHFRYNMDKVYITSEVFDVVVNNFDLMGYDVKKMQIKHVCKYGFNSTQHQMEKIVTYNYINLQSMLPKNSGLLPSNIVKDTETMNYCYIDFFLKPKVHNYLKKDQSVTSARNNKVEHHE